MYLARREHSYCELKIKLEKSYDKHALIDSVLIQLKDSNLQSDARFVDSLLSLRIKKGYGPRYIQAELKQKGISDNLINDTLLSMQTDWSVCCQAAWKKRFKAELPTTKQALQKQQQFLYNRGFEFEQIRGIFSNIKLFSHE